MTHLHFKHPTTKLLYIFIGLLFFVSFSSSSSLLQREQIDDKKCNKPCIMTGNLYDLDRLRSTLIRLEDTIIFGKHRILFSPKIVY